MSRLVCLLAAAALPAAAALCFSEATPQDAPAGWQALAGDAARGQALFEGAGRCIECHRFRGEGSFVRGPSFDPHWRSGPALGERLAERPPPADWPEAVPGDAYLLQSLLEPSAHVVEGYPDAMPAAAGPLLRLGPRELADLLAWLNPAEAPARFVPEELPPPGADPWSQLPVGDPARGEELFFRPDDSSCAGCHLVRLPRLEARFHPPFWREGGLIGPELTRYARVATPQQALAAILRPQEAKTAGFEEGLVETPGERLLVGVLLAAGEPGVLLMKADPGGPQYVFVDSDSVAERTEVELSRMTPVFSELTSPQDRLDLLAFLRQAAAESLELGAAALPGSGLGERAPCAPLYDGDWPEELPLELLQRIPGIRVNRAAPPSTPR